MPAPGGSRGAVSVIVPFLGAGEEGERLLSALAALRLHATVCGTEVLSRLRLVVV